MSMNFGENVLDCLLAPCRRIVEVSGYLFSLCCCTCVRNVDEVIETGTSAVGMNCLRRLLQPHLKWVLLMLDLKRKVLLIDNFQAKNHGKIFKYLRKEIFSDEKWIGIRRM